MKPFRPRLPLLLITVSAFLAACGTTPQKTGQTGEARTAAVKPPYKGGGYYKDDGPSANTPDNLGAIPDAVPRDEPLHAFANNTYKVLGKTYTPLKSNAGYKASGQASWYGRKFHGRPTSSGEPYDMFAMTAAHPILPIPSYARVTNNENGKSVVVRINDRGPFHENRLIDLSYTAAYKLDVLKGVTPVTVEAVLPETAPDSFVAQAGEQVVEPVAQPVTIAANAAAEPVAPAAVAPAAPAAGVETPAAAYYLQLGAFSAKERANELLQRVSTRLSRSFPGVLRLELDGLYKVQAGPFTDPAEMERAAALLHDEMGLKSFKLAGGARPAAPALTAPATPPTATAAAPAEATANPGQTAEAPAPGLYLQLASFSSAAAAEALGERVRAKYGTELPGLTQVQFGNLYRLQAGPFASTEAAAQLSVAYRQDFGTTPYRVMR